MRRAAPGPVLGDRDGDAWLAERLVRDLAKTRGSQPALVGETTRRTWLELDRAVDAAGASLAAAGLRPRGRVAVGIDIFMRALPLVLGAHRLGASVVLLPSGLTPAEQAVALDVVRPDLVVPDGDAPWISHPSGPGEGARVPPGARFASGDPIGPSDPAVVVMTSGTTGRPKGVVLSHRALAASADAWIAALPPATGWLLCVALSHVAGLGVVWRAIRAAVPVRVAAPGDPALQLAALHGSPGDPPLSHVSLVPTQLTRLLDAGGPAPAPGTLRAVLLGGGSIPPALVTRAVGLGWPVIPTYGLSEAGSGVTALPAAEAGTHPGTAGRPLPGVNVTIDRPGHDGIGEILVTTPAAFSGYLGEAPHDAGAPVRTGDLGRLEPDGRLIVLDRRTDRIVRGGENISPAEVEAALEQHPDVAQAALVARPDPTWGQVPVAAIVFAGPGPHPGGGSPAGAPEAGTATRALTDAELTSWCRDRLAGFKVPDRFLRLDALPRTGSGKLRREAIRALVDGSASGILARPDRDWIGWRVTGGGAPGRLPVVLLPGTLSNARQVDRLAGELVAGGALIVHALDRRGSGTSRLGEPGPLDVAVHVDDLRAYLDARGLAAAVLVGHSFGGVVALEAAARLAGRVLAVVAYEPPYGPLADAATRVRFASTATRTAEAYRSGGAALAAETFLRIVAGDTAWTSLSERSRAWLAREGLGAVTDSALTGLDPEGLARIRVPVRLLGGGASLPFYPGIAHAVVSRIVGASQASLSGLTHNAPITDPAPVAVAVRDFLADAGLVPASEPMESRS